MVLTMSVRSVLFAAVGLVVSMLLFGAWVAHDLSAARATTGSTASRSGAAKTAVVGGGGSADAASANATAAGARLDAQSQTVDPRTLAPPAPAAVPTGGTAATGVDASAPTGTVPAPADSTVSASGDF